MAPNNLLYVDQASRSFPLLFPVDSSKSWGNASSSHQYGRDAKAALTEARGRIATALSLPMSGSPESMSKQIIFTSGGTESNNLVLQQPTWQFIISTATEHHAVYYTVQYMANQTDCQVAYLGIDGQGRIRNLDELRQLLNQFSGKTGLVSLAYVNNETGTILDVAAVGQVIKEVNIKRSGNNRVYFHTDAVQAPGHVPMDMGSTGPLSQVDLLSLSAHKFHGPEGVGILVCRLPSILKKPLMFGGMQHGGLRPGTEAMHRHFFRNNTSV